MKTHETTNPAIRRLNLFPTNKKESVGVAWKLLSAFEQDIARSAKDPTRPVNAQVLLSEQDSKTLAAGLQNCIAACNGHPEAEGADAVRQKANKLAQDFGLESQIKPDAKPPTRAGRLIAYLLEMDPFHYKGFLADFWDRFKESLLVDEITHAVQGAGAVNSPPKKQEEEVQEEEVQEEEVEESLAPNEFMDRFKKGNDEEQAKTIRETILKGDLITGRELCIAAHNPETAVVATEALLEAGQEKEILGFIRGSIETNSPGPGKRCAPNIKCLIKAANMDQSSPKSPSRTDVLLDTLSIMQFKIEPKNKAPMNRSLQDPDAGITM